MKRQRRRLSILDMMAVVSVLAADCGLLRTVWDTSTFELSLFVLPMLNLIGLGLSRSKRRPAARPFWIAFEVVGCGMIGAMFFLDWGFRQYDWSYGYSPGQWLFEQGWLSDASTVLLLVSLTGISAISAVFLYLPAFVAGWISGRYRLVRRDAPEDDSRASKVVGRSSPTGTDLDASNGIMRRIWA